MGRIDDKCLSFCFQTSYEVQVSSQEALRAQSTIGLGAANKHGKTTSDTGQIMVLEATQSEVGRSDIRE